MKISVQEADIHKAQEGHCDNPIVAAMERLSGARWEIIECDVSPCGRTICQLSAYPIYFVLPPQVVYHWRLFLCLRTSCPFEFTGHLEKQDDAIADGTFLFGDHTLSNGNALSNGHAEFDGNAESADHSKSDGNDLSYRTPAMPPTFVSP